MIPRKDTQLAFYIGPTASGPTAFSTSARQRPCSSALHRPDIGIQPNHESTLEFEIIFFRTLLDVFFDIDLMQI